jgi:hypothetical protein
VDVQQRGAVVAAEAAHARSAAQEDLLVAGAEVDERVRTEPDEGLVEPHAERIRVVAVCTEPVRIRRLLVDDVRRVEREVVRDAVIARVPERAVRRQEAYPGGPRKHREIQRCRIERD